MIMGRILEKTNDLLSRGLNPLVIFDLDDTLIDCRYRKHRVFQDFIQLPDIIKHFPDDVRRVRNLSCEKIAYRIVDNMDKVGVISPEFRRKIEAFWAFHYFTNPYVAHDHPFPGSVNFVRDLHQAGARIVYFSGRDLPGMGKGTRENLTRLGFPMGENTELVLKPNSLMPDLTFKQLALPMIRRLGEVVAVFENESRNLNAIAEEFPLALLVLLDTLHSPNPPAPRQGTIILKGYLS